MAYNFDVKLETTNFVIEIDTAARYGYFEHKNLGEDRAGGLWFEETDTGALELVDFDGVYALPRPVAQALADNGYLVDMDVNC